MGLRVLCKKRGGASLQALCAVQCVLREIEVMGRLGIVVLAALLGVGLCCVEPDCDTPDCGSCGKLSNQISRV